ncbi:MAG: hypothetical protein IJU76_15400 [Desulfovibrionaceae bacterium]|nr:hypothetical protein [Desulfovibrionaceae bacterium]
MAEGRVYKKVPIETDLVALRERFPHEKMQEGDIFSYEELVEVLRLERQSGRFQSVIGRWKDELLIQHQISLLTLPNQGYKVATDSQKLQQGEGKRDSAMRCLKKSSEYYAAIDRNKLQEGERNVLDSNVKMNASIISALAIKRDLPKPQIG